MADNAASAFGFTGGAREGMNIGGKIKDAATGIMGWSPFQQMKQQPGYEKLMQQLEQFRQAASKQVDYQEPASTSGGKK
ncbi:MAG: hypothetical protein GKR86_00095 [Ilumatobacter sp.]|nr:hypothetical protein [Ilumatobacter sp.]